MALPQKTQELMDDLVQGVAGVSPQANAKEFRAMRDAAAKALRQHRYARTNQFNVEKSLSGLVEKFEVLNKERVAQALERRLQELGNNANKWTPDVLALLLHLSDNPTEKANVEDLESSKQQRNDEPPLTWDEVLGDDPLDEQEKDLWQDIDFARSELDEEEVTLHSEGASEDSEHTQLSSVASDDGGVNLDLLLSKSDREGFSKLRTQLRQKNTRSGEETITITELEAVREVLHMLHGLPSRLFTSETLKVDTRYRLSHISQSGFRHILSDFAQIGRTTGRLRDFSQQKQSEPLLQSFSAAVGSIVHSFDTVISDIEGRFVGIRCPTIVSILSLHHEIESHTRHLPILADLISQDILTYERPTSKLLDDLYNIVDSAHAASDASTYEPVTRMFVSCLETYLKQVRRWMEEGQLLLEDQKFLVQDRDKEADISSFWQHRFNLRHDAKGNLEAPSFMQPFAAEILASGKAISFINALEVPHLLWQHGQTSQPALDIDISSLHDVSTFDSLIPFSAALQDALGEFIIRSYTQSSLTLRNHFMHAYHHSTVLHALETVFLSADGSLFNSLADEITSRIDDLQYTRSDTRLLLEEVARTTFGDAECIDARHLSLTLVPPSRKQQAQQKRRSVKSLASVVLSYSYHPALSNIIPTTLLPTLQSLFTFLLQIRFAKSLLSKSPRHLASPSPKIRNPTLALHHRLLATVTVLESHILLTALAPCIETLHSELDNIDATPTIDALIAVHATFTSSIHARGLQSESLRTARDAITGILDLSVALAALVDEATLVDDNVHEDGKGASEKRTRERLGRMRAQHAELLGLLVAELRSKSREDGGEAGWGVLAERLAW
ncbi:MAG: hypothetical protein M1828_005713 [Chrysothrix sp. TS-e1954]|nr:MAG: hypothetical protein M1828_005713 [Chrysothrix sp. TS-e1954]